MASLVNANRAYVNKSSKKIPIYDPEKGDSKIIGHIYPNEMYATYPLSNISNTIIGVCFRNSSGKFQRGHIFRECPYHGGEPDYAYLAQQKYFHLYNCSGNSLTTSKSQTINGTSCRIFTVKKSVNLYNDTKKEKTLPVGTKLAFSSSTTGKTQVVVGKIANMVDGLLLNLEKVLCLATEQFDNYISIKLENIILQLILFFKTFCLFSLIFFLFIHIIIVISQPFLQITISYFP